MRGILSIACAKMREETERPQMNLSHNARVAGTADVELDPSQRSAFGYLVFETNAASRPKLQLQMQRLSHLCERGRISGEEDVGSPLLDQSRTSGIDVREPPL